MTVEVATNTLTPIVCRYCEHYTTYISFDMELHLFEIHDMRSDRMINDAINEGKRLGAKLEESSIQKLELEYTKYKQKTTAYEEGRAQGVFNFVPIIPVDEFFEDDYKISTTYRSKHLFDRSLELK